MPDDSSARQRRFLKKQQLAERYNTTVRSIERMVADGRLPRPYSFGSKLPRWAEDEVEAAERRAFTGNTAA